MSATGIEGHRTSLPEQESRGLTGEIERYTSSISPNTYLALALGSIGVAAALRLMGRSGDSQFVGHWVPTILLLGLYRKLNERG